MNARREIVERAFREALREVLHGSLPREVGVDVKEVRKGRGGKDVVYVRVELVVHKESLKGVLIGEGGSTIKEIGSRARRKIEERVGKKVYVDARVVRDPERSPVNRWFEVEEPEDVYECPAVKHPHVTYVARSRIRGNARIAAFARVCRSVIHGGVMVSNRAEVSRSELHKRVTVSAHCKVRGSEIDPLTFVGDGAEVTGASVGERCFLGMNSTVRADVGRWSVVGAGASVGDDVPPSSLVVGDGEIVDGLTLYSLTLRDRIVLRADGTVVDSSDEPKTYVIYSEDDNEIKLSAVPTGHVLCLVERVRSKWRVRGKGFERVSESPSLHWYVGDERGLLR